MIATKRLVFWPVFLGLTFTMFLAEGGYEGHAVTLLRNWTLSTLEVFVLMWSAYAPGWVARLLFALSVSVIPFVLLQDASPGSDLAWEWGAGTFVVSLLCKTIIEVRPDEGFRIAE